MHVFTQNLRLFAGYCAFTCVKCIIIAQAIEEQRQQNKKKLQQFDDLFNSLLQKSFKGELDLKSTEYA